MSDVGVEKSPGAAANKEFVANMKEQYPELEKLIPEACLACSTAWSRLSHGHAEKLSECRGEFSKMVGSAAIMMCHYGSSVEK